MQQPDVQPFAPQPQQPYPYAFPMMVAPPAKQYPVPEGRRVPTIWTMTLIVLAVGAALAAIFGGLLRPVAPAPFGTKVYANSLAQDDGAWQLANDPANMCVFANGSLDATADETATTTSPSCTLSAHTVTDFDMSVRLLPPAASNTVFLAAIFVRASETDGVAFIISDTGLIDVYVPNQRPPVLSFTADQWHANMSAGNVFVIQAQGSTYTLAMNGVEVYQGDLNGYAVNAAGSGSIALGAAPPVSGSTEARFTDFTLTAP
ncbi:MAG: hypothetical protein H0X24_11995 [Ktedonobacterales bacterium]|nr:hypothetical protein [Ktedonobacterales bacterium]